LCLQACGFFEFFSGTLSSARPRSLHLIAVRPRNSTIRCLLLYFSNTPALPFTMVARVPAQVSTPRLRLTPAARRRSLPLETASHSQHTLFLAPLCFHILTNCFSRNPFVLTTIPIVRGCVVQTFDLHACKPVSHLFLITSLQTQQFHAITHSFMQRRTNIPTILNSLRTLSVATGVVPPCISPGSFPEGRVRKSFRTHRQKDYRSGSSSNPRYNRAAHLGGEGS